ncbi:hypothetical protein DVH05_017230 [Phytophthora capsici]|nr:hypothetical protein DVH05_017230 [Phytophthora capsici]
MRIFAALSAYALAFAAASAHESTSVLSLDAPEAVHMQGDVWEDGRLVFRLMMDEDTANTTTPSDELLALATVSTGSASCEVDEGYELKITVSKCLSSSEYSKLWSMGNWPLSNARFGSKTFKYKDCSSDVSPVTPPVPVSAPPRLEVLAGKTKQKEPGAVAVRVCPNLDCGVLPTDIVVTTLTGVNNRIPQAIRDLIDCPTPKNSVSGEHAGCCQCTCPGGSVMSYGECTCTGGRSLVGGG